MLLFKDYFMNRIQRGEKTQTRRVWRKPRAKIGALHLAKTNYTKDYFAKLLILDVHKERLGDITKVDALREGFESIADFKSEWTHINRGWDPDLIVTVVTFKVVPNLDVKPGDVVKMSPECAEYLTHGDKLWTVASHPFWIGYTEGVFLEGFSGYFSTKCLELYATAEAVNVGELEKDCHNVDYCPERM